MRITYLPVKESLVDFIAFLRAVVKAKSKGLLPIIYQHVSCRSSENL